MANIVSALKFSPLGTYSNASTWTVNQGTYTNNNVTAPNGTTTAATLTLTASSYDFYQNHTSLTVGDEYVVGVWVKLGTATNFVITVNNTQDWNTVTARAFTSADGLKTTGWTHVSVKFIVPSNGTINLHIGGHNESGTPQQTAGTVFVWNWEFYKNDPTQLSVVNSTNAYTSTAAAHILLTNPSAAGQTHIDFVTNSSLKGKIRSDYEGNMIFVTNTSGNERSHQFWTNGDAATGVLRMYISEAGNVGIGTNTPQSSLHVAGTLPASPTGTGVHLGIDAGGYAGIQLNGGTSQGAYIDFSCSGVDAPGRIIYSNTANSMDFTVCSASRMTIVCNGNIGINTTTPGSYKLNVNGAFYAAGSSCEYKTQICQYNTDSCMFMKLTPVTYQYKDEYTHLGKELKSGTQIGLIAEDVAEVYPELAILKDEEDEKIVRNVDYEKLSIVLLSEVQKLRKELDELKTK